MIHKLPQTKEQKIAMYMKMPKKELAAMLQECNRILAAQLPTFKVQCDKCGKFV